MRTLLTPFPTPLTNRQWFYLLVLQGVGAGIIDGGANFGVAYAMYHNQKSIKMWVLAENTIAGDLGVTPIIQCFASMLITSTLVHTDLHHHAVLPLPFVWPHVEHLPDPREVIDSFRRKGKGKRATTGSGSSTPDEKSRPDAQEQVQVKRTKGLGYYVRMLIRFIFEGTEFNILLPLSRSTPLRILLTAAQGAGLGIVCGLPLWLLFIVVLGPIYGHDNMAETGWRWAPMVIKCVYGAVLGWITNPVIASLALGSQAEHHLLVVSEDVEELAAEPEAQAQTQAQGQEGGVEVIHEDEELSIPPNSPLPPAIQNPTGSLRAPSLLLTPTRPRARSRASSTLSNRSRPPLTANCSNLPLVTGTTNMSSTSGLGISVGPIPPAATGRKGSFSSLAVPRTPRSTPLPSGEFNLLAVPTGEGAPGGPATPTPTAGSVPRHTGRGRGATISTYPSGQGQPQPQPGTPSGTWSYALGGTGGRAQRRPRAVSSVSGKNAQIGPGPTTTTTRTATRPTPHVDGSASTPKIQVGQIPPSQSSTGGAPALDAAQPVAEATGASAGARNARNAVWDVFGRVEESSAPLSPPAKVGRRSISIDELARGRGDGVPGPKGE